MQLNDFKQLSKIIHKVLAHQLFFVVGAQKSGTTWLQKLLDAHPEILCSGEGHFADILAVDLTKMLDKYDHMMHKVGERVYENQPYYEKMPLDGFNYLVLSMAAIMWSQRDISDTIKCIGDKTPANANYIGPLYNIFPHAKFIHIVRDGRDVLVSRVKHSQRVALQHPNMNPDDFSYEQKTEEYTNVWATLISKAQDFAQQNPGTCHTVKYEALKETPEIALDKIFQFLNVDNSSKVIAHCMKEASFEKLSGGRKPGEENPDAFLRKGIVGDWKNHLDETTLRIFNKTGGKVMEALGYH